MNTPIHNAHPEIKGMLEKMIADKLERRVVDEETVKDVVHELVELRQCLALVTGTEPTVTKQTIIDEITPEEIDKIIELVKVELTGGKPTIPRSEPYVHKPRRSKMTKLSDL